MDMVWLTLLMLSFRESIYRLSCLKGVQCNITSVSLVINAEKYEFAVAICILYSLKT